MSRVETILDAAPCKDDGGNFPPTFAAFYRNDLEELRRFLQ